MSKAQTIQVDATYLVEALNKPRLIVTNIANIGATMKLRPGKTLNDVRGSNGNFPLAADAIFQ
jgi:hypothetical protein